MYEVYKNSPGPAASHDPINYMNSQLTQFYSTFTGLVIKTIHDVYFKIINLFFIVKCCHMHTHANIDN